MTLTRNMRLSLSGKTETWNSFPTVSRTFRRTASGTARRVGMCFRRKHNWFTLLLFVAFPFSQQRVQTRPRHPMLARVAAGPERAR